MRLITKRLQLIKSLKRNCRFSFFLPLFLLPSLSSFLHSFLPFFLPCFLSLLSFCFAVMKFLVLYHVTAVFQIPKLGEVPYLALLTYFQFMTSKIILCPFINWATSNASYSPSESNGWFPDKNIYTHRDSSLCKAFPKENPSGVVLMPSFVVHMQLLSRLLQVSQLSWLRN